MADDLAYQVAVLDEDADGDYSDLVNTSIVVDANRNGSIDGGETHVGATSPIVINGDTFKITELTPAGDTLVLAQAGMGTVAGRITDATTGGAIAGARVRLGALEDTTDASGNYVLATPEGTYYELVVGAPGYVPSYYYMGAIVAGQAVTLNISLALPSAPQSAVIQLHDGESYDFLTGHRGQWSGGDFYASINGSVGSFWANNMHQQGLQDIGDVGPAPLWGIQPPSRGYTKWDVTAIPGHTYVSLARTGAEGHYIIFRVQRIQPDDYIEILYYYR
jgi:hypothetical protein